MGPKGAMLHMTAQIVIFEGIDGSGKTTLLRNIAKQLQLQGKRVLPFEKRLINDIADRYSKESLKLYKSLRDLIYVDDSVYDVAKIPVSTWMYLSVTYYDILYNQYILGEAENFDFILIDGWWYKLFARIMITTPEDSVRAQHMSKMLPDGDICIFLDVSLQEAWRRKNGSFSKSELGILNDNASYLKNINDAHTQYCSFQTKVRENMLSLLSPRRVHYIEADACGLEQLTDMCMNYLGTVSTSKVV